MQTTFGSYLVAVLAASAELASALPPQMDLVRPRTAAPEPGRTLTVPVRHSMARRARIQHPALVYARALRKFNGTIPSHVQGVVDRFALLSKREGSEEGTVSTSPTESDSEYITTISVGTPAQNLPMDFDTGSSDLWVMGPTISGASKTYNPSDSSSATQMTGSTWSISYGDGSSSSGNVYKDTVTIGNLTVSDQAVEVATTVSSEFTQDDSMSGLVGLAMSSLNTVKPTAQQTWFDNIKSSLASGVFTADLNHEKAGTYGFGFIDESAYTGTMYYADLVTSGNYGGYWTFAASGYAVGGGSSTTSGSGSSSSGTSSSSGSSATGSSGSGSSGTGTSSSSGSSSTGGYGSYGGGGYSGGYGGGSDGSDSDSGSDIFGTSTSDSSSSDSTSDSSSDSSGLGSLGDLISSLESGFGSSGFGFRGKKERKAVAATKTTTPKRSVTLTDTAITGIADTGTTLAMLPDAVVSAYYAQVSGAEESQTEGGWVFPCTATLPSFTFGVGEGQITIPADYMNYMEVDSSGSSCYGGIQSDADIGMAIFGDIALKAAYVVFDSENSRVGWAAKTTT